MHSDVWFIDARNVGGWVSLHGAFLGAQRTRVFQKK
jgi:hypothetical protein